MNKLDERNIILKNLVSSMAKKVVNLYEMAIYSLNNHDVEKALKVIETDDYINKQETEINDVALETVVLYSPVAIDVRIVISSIKIANELERIGDYAKGIAKFAIKHEKIDADILSKINTLNELFLKMFSHAMEAYENADVDWAFKIAEEDLQINGVYNEIVEIIKNKLSENNKEFLDETVNVMRLIKNLERAGDHTKNICEHIIYQEKGQRFEFN